MSNPFIGEEAGVFATVSAVSQGPPPLAALICAALAKRLAEPPPGTAPLDQQWWSDGFNQVPLLSAGGTVNASIGDASPSGLAALCLGAGVQADAPGGPAALARWIGAIRPAPVLLNSIAVTGDSGTINLSLAFFDVGAGHFTRTDATINTAIPANLKSLQKLFEAFDPPAGEPYFCSL